MQDGGGGEPTVTETVHDELRAGLDAALDGLGEGAPDQGRVEAAARTTAETKVTKLEGQIGDMDDPVSESLRGDAGGQPRPG